MLPVKQMCVLLFACFLVIQTQLSEAFGQEVLEQYMTGGQDSYNRLSKE
jgi:hypothetical protein